MALNVKQVEKLVRDAKPGSYPAGDGLYLRVSATGTASWAFRYQLNGKRRMMGLGSHKGLTLAEAREKAREAQSAVKRGHDPLETRRDEEPDAVTFEKLAADFIKKREPTWRNAKHGQQWKNTLAMYVYPHIGDKHPDEIETIHIQNVIDPIWNTKRETARRVRNRIELILNYARALGLTDKANPAAWRGHLDAIYTDARKEMTEHHAAMPYEEVPRLMQRLRLERDSLSSRALMLTILCATRTSETLEATWDEINLERRLWVIPGRRMKAGVEHRIPLSDDAVKVLESLPTRSGYLFPGKRKGRPLSNMSMMMALRRLGHGDLTVHGFRSSFRDWAAEETHYPNHVAEMALAHTVSDAVERAYRRGDMLEKRRQMMQEWANYLKTAA